MYFFFDINPSPTLELVNKKRHLLDDICLYFLSTNIEEKYHNTFCRLSTFLKICGQNVDKQLILTIFYVDKILAKPHKINYLPWHCLYFFPEPHGKILNQPGNFFLLKWYFLLQFFDVSMHSRMISFFIIKINSIIIISKDIN